MKKLISALILSGALVLTGCGDSHNDINQVSGQQNPPIVNPTPPQPTAGFFVDGINGDNLTAEAAADNNTPSSDTPFKTIQAAVAKAPANATITVLPGNYTGAVALKDGQKLLAANISNKPVLDNTITLANGNTVNAFRIANATDFGINGNNRNGGVITDCEITGIIRTGANTGTGIHIAPGSGSWSIEGNTILNAQGVGIIADAAGSGSAIYRINGNTITNSAFNGIGFVTEDASQVLAQVNGNTLTNNGTNATIEILMGGSSTFGLDLEDNQNDDVYAFYLDPLSSAVLSVEQLTTLTQPKPAGAGNTGTVDDGTAIGGLAPTEVPNGTFTF